MGELDAGELRYTAFLSYSHKDSAAAGRLHRRLETYKLPKRLVGTETPRGPVPERLWPIFRDRDELPAATDLSETVKEALARSGALIVLCSPHAANSLWVAEEIQVFRALHPDRPVLAAVLDADPPECFPGVLRAFGHDGTWHEPLATDLRRHCDGPQLGLLKLVAGITGVGLDDLVQRDASRRVRRLMVAAAVAIAAMLAMAGLALLAIDARREAERQRTEAEGLIAFMVTDLRTKLKEVGRLDIMADVAQRALLYYKHQNIEELGPDSLEKRAWALHAMGEIDLIRENPNTAVIYFNEAHRTTGEQLSRARNDPERIFAHSQSEFYLGNHAYNQGRYVTARQAFERYRALANELIAINPRNADWLKEAAFAEGNLCTMDIEARNDAAAALRSCVASLRRMEAAARASGNMSDYRSHLANRHGYVADALRKAGRLPDALSHQRRRLNYLDRQLIVNSTDAAVRARRVWALRGLANVEAGLGQTAQAAARMAGAIALLEELVRFDPTNADWRRQLGEMNVELAEIRSGRRRRD